MYLRSLWRKPVKDPMTPLNKIMGKPIRVSFTAKSNCSPSKPLAVRRTICGENIQAKTIRMSAITRVILIILLVCLTLASLPSYSSISDKTGTKVVDMEAVRRFVIREVAVKATKKVSVSMPEPNLAAISISRIKPRNLLPRVRSDTINADLAALCVVVISVPVIFADYSINV